VIVSAWQRLPGAMNKPAISAPTNETDRNGCRFSMILLFQKAAMKGLPERLAEVLFQ
jgi:hypothetical protein